MFLEVMIIAGICILSYFLGCFSSARILARSFRHLNVYKVGTGQADIYNIFNNVSKSLGTLAATLDMVKIYVYLMILKQVLPLTNYDFLSSNTLIFLFGFFLMAGHCLPLTHNFKGGRGVFTFTGMMLVFIPFGMLGVMLVAAVLAVFFKQYRLAQYLIVLLPPILCYFIHTDSQFILMVVITALLMGILNFIVSKRLGEI